MFVFWSVTRWSKVNWEAARLSLRLVAMSLPGHRSTCMAPQGSCWRWQVVPCRERWVWRRSPSLLQAETGTKRRPPRYGWTSCLCTALLSRSPGVWSLNRVSWRTVSPPSGSPYSRTRTGVRQLTAKFNPKFREPSGSGTTPTPTWRTRRRTSIPGQESSASPASWGSFLQEGPGSRGWSTRRAWWPSAPPSTTRSGLRPSQSQPETPSTTGPCRATLPWRRCWSRGANLSKAPAPANPEDVCVCVSVCVLQQQLGYKKAAFPDTVDRHVLPRQALMCVTLSCPLIALSFKRISGTRDMQLDWFTSACDLNVYLCRELIKESIVLLLNWGMFVAFILPVVTALTLPSVLYNMTWKLKGHCGFQRRIHTQDLIIYSDKEVIIQTHSCLFFP